jgi:DNA-dependent RNA polymerase auxiliary subunit epsilon
MPKEYEIRITAYVQADSLKEAEELYADGEYSIDYHVIVDEDGTEYDQNDIEALDEDKG